MADSDVSVVINADATGVSSAITSTDALATSLANIEKYLQTMAAASADATGATETLAGAHRAAAASAGEHAASETILGAALGKTEAATNAAARTFSALGFQTAEATERVEGLVEALDAVGKAALPLLALGAAVLGVAAAFNFLADGVKEAGKAQVAMATLGQAVKDQGGAWNDAAQDGVERFLDAIEHATTYSRGEALDAINKLVTAGASLADAEKMTAIATDVAAGSHKSLTEVVDILKEAEASRGRGLVMLDENLKGLVNTHGHMSAVLDELSEKYRGQAAAALDTYYGHTQELKNELGHLAEEVGLHLLPMLTDGTEVVIGFAEQAEAHVPEIVHFFGAIIDGAVNAANTLRDLWNLTPNAPGLDHLFSGQAWADSFKASGDAWKDLSIRYGGGSTSPTGNWQRHTYTRQDIANQHRAGIDDHQVGDVYWTQQQAAGVNGSTADVIAEILKTAEEKAKAVHDQAAKDLATIRDQALQHDSILGNQSGAGGPTDVEPLNDDAVQKTQAYEWVQKQLDTTLKGLTDSEKAYKDKVDLATDSTDAANAKMALAKKQSDDAKEALGLLTGQIAYETNELARQTAIRNSSEAAMNASREAYNNYGASLGEGTKRTVAERDELKRLSDEHKDAKTKFEESSRAIDGLTSSLERNQAAADAARSNMNDLAKAQAALLRAYNDGTNVGQTKNTIALATFQQPLEAQRRVYEQYIASLDKADADYLAHKLEAENEIRAIDLKMAEDPQVRAAKEASAQQSLDDEEATYKKSLAQQIAYYQARYAATVGGNAEQEAENQKYFDEILKLEGDEYKQRLDQHDAFMQTLKSSEESMLDQIIEKHESFKEAIKNIWKQIADDVEKNVVSNLLGGATQKGNGATTGGGLLSGLNGFIASIFGGSSSASSAANAQAPSQIVNPLNAIQTNTAAIVTHLSNAESASGQDTPGSNPIVDLGSNTINAWGGSTDGSVPSTSSTGNIGQESFGGSEDWGSSGTSLSSIAVNAVQGAGVGQLISGLVGGNSTNASIGGTLGASLGTIIGTLGGATGGPLGSLIGTVLGSLVGGLFGSHATPATSPDIFNTQTYGQDYANLMGSQSGANGQFFLPNQQTAAFIAAEGVGNGGFGQTTLASNGTQITSGGVDAAEIWLSQQNPNSPPPGYTTAEWGAQLAQWTSQFGSSSTGSGQLSLQPGNPNIGDLMISGAGGQPIMTNYSTLGQDLNAIEAAAAADGSNTGVFGLTRTYPTFASTLGPQVGTINSQNNAFTPTNGAGATSAGGGSVSYTINVNAAPIGVVPADVATAIATALQDISKGIVPGSMTLSLAQRAGGN